MAKDWQHRLNREKTKQHLQEFADWSREELISHITELRELVQATQKDTQNTTDSSIDKQWSQDDYNQKWSYTTKIAFLITLKNEPLTSEILHNLLLQLDNHYKDYDSPKNNLTVVLGRAVKSGRIVKHKEAGIRELYYLLPDWINTDGKIKSEYRNKISKFK